MAYTQDQNAGGLDTLDNTTLATGDLAIVGDISDSNRAKGITWANIKLFLKTYFDSLYPSGSGTSTGTNTGDQTLSDATITSTDITTNNVTSSKHGFAPKSPADATQFLNGAATPAFAAVKDSDLSTTDITTNNVSTSKHGFAPKVPNDATKYLDGTGAYSVPPSGSSVPTVKVYTDVATTGRFIKTTGGSAAITFGGGVGTTIDTGASSGSYAVLRLAVPFSKAEISGTIVSFQITLQNSPAGTTWTSFFGAGLPTVDGANITFTDSHIGFKLVAVASVYSLYATQANGTTETASSALTTLASGDNIEVIWKSNGTSVDYYWRKNGGSMSSATNLSTNLPTSLTSNLTVNVSNQNNAQQVSLQTAGFGIER